jgi:prepilin-type N-terminal cleavage/methylation domain-containing protein
MNTTSKSGGFTLIELLVVVAIIGILAAIAIPQFAAYRQRGFDAKANTDLRAAATAEEAYYATNVAYKSCSGISGCQAALPGFFTGSAGVQIQMTANGQEFTGTSKADFGSGKVFNYNSALGGMTN